MKCVFSAPAILCIYVLIYTCVLHLVLRRSRRVDGWARTKARCYVPGFLMHVIHTYAVGVVLERSMLVSRNKVPMPRVFCKYMCYAHMRVLLFACDRLCVPKQQCLA
jgi:hypothetical protein